MARMVQMVGNLVNNALKFTQPAGLVEVGVRKRGVVCEVSVRDNGSGIEPHELDSVFDPFVQAERTRRGARGGMGIGLALVRELALGHGGWVRALSAGPGQGTEILLTLPLAVDQTDAVSTGSGAKVEQRASVRSVARRDPAVVGHNDLLHEREAQARAIGLGQDGVKVLNVNLGALKTDMTKGRPNWDMLVDPAEAAQVIVRLCRDCRSLRVTSVDIKRNLY